MIYMRCPTCSYILGNRQIPCEKKFDEINNDPNIDDKQKLELKTKFLNNIGIKRYCCKMRIITYKSKPLIIK